MARHFFVFDLLVLTGVLAFLYDFFLLGLAVGNIRPLSVITFGCLIGIYFYLIFVLPWALENENFKENLEHEILRFKLKNLADSWEDKALVILDSRERVAIMDRVLEVRALLDSDPPKEVESK